MLSTAWRRATKKTISVVRLIDNENEEETDIEEEDKAGKAD